MPWQHTRGSALLGWVKDDAEYLAAEDREPSPSRTRAPAAEQTEHRGDEHEHTTDHFPQTSTGLPEARAPELVELADGDEFELRIAPVAKRIGERHGADAGLQRLDPGARSSRCSEGSEIVVNVENQGDMEATVHWHGLRLENRYDGTHETQAPIQVGESFSARVTFPDPGVYWYHPHIREDYGQEMGLYGNVLVEPADPDYWPPAQPRAGADARRHPARGRQGRAVQPDRDDARGDGPLRRLLLVNGETDLSLDARLGEVVRLYLTNTANTRSSRSRCRARG